LAIYDPELFLSRDDRELLRLLANLLLSCEESDVSRNLPAGEVPLSYSETRTLLELLEQFVTSKKFQEGSYFIEKLFGSANLYDKELRDIYLGWRRRYGKSRAVATIQWENFLGRLGVWTTDRGNPNLWYRASASPMPLEHFFRMERRLATSAGLHPRVRALILDFLRAREVALEAMRRGEAALRQGQVREPPTKLLTRLMREESGPTGVAPISTSKLTGILTIVMDFATLFTTRDWSVTSVLSATAGALPPVLLD
jgi:hypothetical protein